MRLAGVPHAVTPYIRHITFGDTDAKLRQHQVAVAF